MAQGRFVGTPRISELKKFPIRIRLAAGSDGDHEPVAQLKKAHFLVFLGIEIQSDQNSGKTAVARQTPLPDHQNFPGARQIVIGLIKEHMTESGTDQRAQENVQKEARQMFFRLPLTAIDLHHDQYSPLQNPARKRCRTSAARKDRL